MTPCGPPSASTSADVSSRSARPDPTAEKGRRSPLRAPHRPDGGGKPMTDSPELDAWAALAGRPTVAVVGLGGAGSEAVSDLLALGIPGVRAFAVNTDASHLLRTGVEERILLGHRELRGRGSGGDRDAVLRGAREGKEELLRRLRPFEIVFLLAGLGGGTGSALLPFLSRELRQTHTLPIPVAFLPFQVELDTNSNRRENVDATVADLEGMGGFLLALSNEKLRRFDS